MARGKKTRTRMSKAKRKPRAAAKKKTHSKKKAHVQYEQHLPVFNYEQTLLNGIISTKKPSTATEYSVLFNSVLSTLTPGLRSVHYRSGFSVGRSLYQIYQSKKHYLMHEESISDIVSFLENAGYANITYHIFPDRTDIKFNNRDRTFLGANVHVFESGLIGGFLSASMQQHVRVEEIACSNNGSRHCHFVTSGALVQPSMPNGRDVLKNFIDSVRTHMGTAGATAKSDFSEEYLVLASSVLLGHEYSRHMHRIVRHLGSEISSGLNYSVKTKRLERLFALLGLGKLTVKPAKHLNIELRLDRLKAKKGFVDISIAFLNGLLGGTLAKGTKLSTKGAKKDNSYVISIMEAR